MRRPLPGAAVALACLTTVALAADDRYGDADFVSLDKIDAQVHLYGRADGILAEANREGFRLLTINVDYPDFPDLDTQQQDAMSLPRSNATSSGSRNSWIGFHRRTSTWRHA